LIVKRNLKIVSFVVLMLAVTMSLNARIMGAKTDNYHYAMSLCLQHSADNAKVLYDQAAKGELNQEMEKDLVEQIGKDLDRARVYHARLHKSYTEAESQLIAEQHIIILHGHTKAADAYALLKTEIEKTKPNIEEIKTQTAAIFDGTTKAAAAHLEAMKKLGVSEVKNPSL
jgi:hypothetical protein